jgi:hypothetical protein
MRSMRSAAAAVVALALVARVALAAPFPDLIKDPADIVNYTMDWTSRLPTGVKISSIATKVNGDVTVLDKTASYPASVLTLQVSSGSSIGWTGDPQIAVLSVVTVTVTLTDGELFSRSFNVVERTL